MQKRRRPSESPTKRIVSKFWAVNLNDQTQILSIDLADTTLPTSASWAVSPERLTVAAGKNEEMLLDVSTTVCRAHVTLMTLL